jgi:CheY-like chemotaxis protein
VGKGSVFRIYLPALAEETVLENEVHTSEAWPRGQGECILVVDDEPMILTITQQTLETFGYRVLTAEHGAQAISLFALNHGMISLVFTDMMMPVMDGPSTVVALREIDINVKVVATSGLNDEGHVAKATNAGVKHFLAKPYTTHSLLDMVRTALSDKS